jgi:hypothetical protein
MKKMIAIAAVTVMLVSCGGSSTTEVTTIDSTVVKADTTVTVDTTKVVDTAK